ncbi:MAG TPA: glycosyltransferase family 2 protein, partial [Candidatus Limnocylindrales bacterium]|nr:glycosyltransferase family 2 protein [Candidatus Limnocylindrales bacterium]
MTPPSGPSGGVPAGAPLNVSVVVPVYNPGRYLEACVSSVLGQTMPRQEYEAIFVDDGSTDGSAEYLDALAAREPNVRVLHLPGSGAPGGPRNAGVDAARGTFVQFLDSDDELAPDALERLHRMAAANGTDIVLGKFASASMPRRQDLFRVTRRRCTLVDTPGLVDGSLGPTKLFRTALLRRHAIRFPEGWRHMEDQLFTIHAYLRARSFSILGDAPCYWFNVREDGSNISHERVDPAVHMAHLGEIVDLVERAAPPGELRDRIVRRFYRAEALARLNETTYLDQDPDYQAALFAAIRDFARAKVPQRLDADLGIVTALRSSLVRRGRQAETVELAERARAVDVRAVAGSPRWRGGRLIVPFEAWLARSADDPFVVVERDGRFVLDPTFTSGIAERPVAIADPTRSARATAILREPESVLEWILPSTSSVELVDVGTLDGGRCLRPTIRGSITVDPEHVGPEFQRLAPGTWDLLVRLASLGIERTSLVVLDPGPGPAEGRRPAPAPQPALLGRPARFVVPSVGPSRGLVVHVGAARDEPWPAPPSDPAAAPLGRSLALRRAALLGPPPELELLLP